MFGIWKKKKPEVQHLDRWTFEQFECSPAEFYQSIEDELNAHHVPGLFVERIEYKEGGILSAKRDYLRIRRERIVFDLCLAPIGDFWFISRRASIIPFSLEFWEVLVVLVVLASVAAFYIHLFGLIFGCIVFAGSIIGVSLLMRNLVVLGLADLDAAVLQVPVLGAIYESYFRKETYFREDTRHAYLMIVNSVVKTKIDELMGQKGARLMAYRDDTPPSHPTVMALIGALLDLRR